MVINLHGALDMQSNDRSCGAASRLLTDAYLINMWPDRVTINQTPWTILVVWDTGAVLEHHAEPDAITRETMFLEWGLPGRSARAELVLTGATESRASCSNHVSLVGTRER